MGKLGPTEIIMIIAIILVLLALRKEFSSRNKINNDDRNRNENNSSKTNINIDELIPDHCPQCKNPNTKKIRLCEWCGNQIV